MLNRCRDAYHVPMPHPAWLSEEELLARCEVQRTRGSGPGGQNRNKVETAIRLVDRPTGLEVWASERRTQGENRAAAVFRLRVKLAIGVREPVDPGAPASACWQGRVKAGRLAINPGHNDFPALLAEALDRIRVYGYDIAGAARALGLNTSQLIKLLRHEPIALETVNQSREVRGLGRLR
ncbi:MAG: peptide chain release factor-like protein [Planctomycetota bacterium]